MFNQLKELMCVSGQISMPHAQAYLLTVLQIGLQDMTRIF